MGLKLEWRGTSFPHRLLRGKDLALIPKHCSRPKSSVFFCPKTALLSRFSGFLLLNQVKTLDKYGCLGV